MQSMSSLVNLQSGNISFKDIPNEDIKIKLNQTSHTLTVGHNTIIKAYSAALLALQDRSIFTTNLLQDLNIVHKQLGGGFDNYDLYESWNRAVSFWDKIHKEIIPSLLFCLEVMKKKQEFDAKDRQNISALFDMASVTIAMIEWTSSKSHQTCSIIMEKPEYQEMEKHALEKIIPEIE